MESSRRLAAIMFTDIVGYTSAMARDEQEAMALLQENQQIQTSLVNEHHGQMLKEMGDGTLLCFQSALDAVQCALGIQEATKEIPNLRLRIGIHVGDVLFKGADVFGDGVNVASRIEPFAKPGGVCVSEQIYILVRNQPGIEAEYIGEKTLKNVSNPVKIFVISRKEPSEKSPATNTSHRNSTRKSIAVLPFTNMSADREQDYFCDGIAEDILNDLTNLEDLHVVSRTSSFAFKGKSGDIRDIGRKLGAETIVEGSVRKAGNRLRITAQLIQVSDGYHLWSERYDTELEDVFAIQDEISKNIVRALKAKLSKREKHILEKVTTQDIQAYDFYIRGRAYSRMISAGKTPLAIQMFKKAIQRDPGYALAYAGLADTYTNAFMWFEGDVNMMELADKASQKALELDPELAEAYISRGLCLSTSKRYDEAEAAFKTAISLNPQLFDAYYQYGRTAKAQRKNEQAAKLLEKATALRPENYEATVFLTNIYCDLGMKKEAEKSEDLAITALRNHVDLNPEDTRALYLGANVFASSGKSNEAREWIEQAMSLEPDEPGVLYNAACVYSLLGDHEKALDLFERRIEIGHAHGYKDWIRNDTDLDPIRDHPRFQKAFARLK